MFIALVVIHFSEIRVLRTFKVSGWAREIDVKTHVLQIPLSWDSQNTLTKSYSLTQRTEKPSARVLLPDG